MKRALCVLGWALVVAGSAQAQNFVNLDFEAIRFVPPAPGSFQLLTWDEAAPGWSHSEGDSTQTVNYLYEHLGFSQNYVLLDRTVASSGAIAGSFALGMKSGTFYEGGRGGFTNAFIEQRGWVPPGTTSLRMLANSNVFQVLIDQVPIAMHPLGLDPTSPTYDDDRLWYVGEWSGDISSFAGRVADLKIVDWGAPWLGYPRLLIVDNIRLLAVPEPSTAALVLAGLLLGIRAVYRRRSVWRAAQR